jgi:uncharacterized membrane protein
MHRVLVGLVVVLALGTTAAMTLLANRDVPVADEVVDTGELLDGTILDVVEVPVGAAEAQAGVLPPGAIEVELTVRLDGTGEVLQLPRVVDETGDTYRPGQRVRVEASELDGSVTYSIVDFQRDRPLLVLAGLFVVAVLAFGRLQGLRALVGLALTAIVVVTFLIPSILSGEDPVLVALAAALAIMILTLYLTHGAAPKTTAAVVGTALALLLTGLLAAAFVEATSLTGLYSEEARLANLSAGGISLRGLLLAGILLGGLGVLDDVTVSQSSLVFELARADRSLRFPGLVRSALRVGRDHVAATVNTLFLAYAGASLPLLILFSASPDPVTTTLTREIVAVEVVRTLVGSLGLIAAVPLTTALAAALAIAERDEEPVENLPALPAAVPLTTGLQEPREPVGARSAPGPASETFRWQAPPRDWSTGDLGPPRPTGEPPGVNGMAERTERRLEPEFLQPGAFPQPVEPPRAAPPPDDDWLEPDTGGAGDVRRRQDVQADDALRRPSRAELHGRRSRRGRPAPAPREAERPDRRPTRSGPKTAADAEQEQLEEWFRLLRNPYGRRDEEE